MPYVQVQKVVSAMTTLKFVTGRSKNKAITDIEEKRSQWRSIHNNASELMERFNNSEIQQVKDIDKYCLQAELLYIDMKNLQSNDRPYEPIDIQNFTGYGVEEFIKMRNSLQKRKEIN